MGELGEHMWASLVSTVSNDKYMSIVFYFLLPPWRISAEWHTRQPRRRPILYSNTQDLTPSVAEIPRRWRLTIGNTLQIHRFGSSSTWLKLKNQNYATSVSKSFGQFRMGVSLSRWMAILMKSFLQVFHPHSHIPPLYLCASCPLKKWPFRFRKMWICCLSRLYNKEWVPLWRFPWKRYIGTRLSEFDTSTPSMTQTRPYISHTAFFTLHEPNADPLWWLFLFYPCYIDLSTLSDFFRFRVGHKHLYHFNPRRLSM